MAAKPTSAPAHQPPDLSSLCLAITEHAPLPMATVEGASHIVRYVNPAFCRLMDKPAEQLVGKPFAEMMPEKADSVALLDRVYRTGKSESHTEQQHSKPHPVFWSYTMWPVLADERPVGVMIQVTETAQFQEQMVAMNEALILGSLRQHELTEAADASNAQLQTEVTDRKQVEAALRESEERFRTLFELGPVAVYSCDVSGVIREFNRRAAELWGREPALGDTDERFCGSFKLSRPDGSFMPHEQCPMAEVIAGKIPGARDAEVLIERPDGSRITVVVNIRPLKDARGEITGAINCFYDITERKKTEEILRDTAERKNEFLAMLGHELRNPLAPIRYMLEIMKRAEGNGDLIRPALGTMERQLRQMTQLIDDLLDVNRISQGKLQLRREEVELASVIQHVVEASRPAMESAQHQLTVTLPPQPVYLDADPVRLAQVFGNLLHNAYKFTRPGGRVSLAAEQQGGEVVVVTVKDSGIGIPSNMLPKIFEMFMQGDQTLERSQGGLGIGLTLVRRLVEMHGGSVQAFSDGLDRGSEFVVRLPGLIEKPKALSPDPTVGESTPMTARRILVVDDNHDSANSLAMLLKMTGHETHTAFDGLEAVEAAERFRPEVILMDIGLPKLSGFDVARRIREQQWGQGMVLVALTGWGQDEDRRKTADAGFNGHLVKPVDYAALMKLLASLPVVGSAG